MCWSVKSIDNSSRLGGVKAPAIEEDWFTVSLILIERVSWVNKDVGLSKFKKKKKKKKIKIKKKKKIKK